MNLLSRYLMNFGSLGTKTQKATSFTAANIKLFSMPSRMGGPLKKRGVDCLRNIISEPQVNISLAKASRVDLPRVSSGLPFRLHNSATGNAVTRRLPKLTTQYSSPIRSRAMRYRG